jgi:Tol biopolymer transport system component
MSVYVRIDGGPEAEMWLVDADTGTGTRVIPSGMLDEGMDDDLEWSPDGSTLGIRARTKDGGGSILLLDASSGELRTLTECYGDEEGPCPRWASEISWSSDSQTIAFSRVPTNSEALDGGYWDFQEQLTWIDVNTGDVGTFTDEPLAGCCLAWRPVPKDA